MKIDDVIASACEELDCSYEQNALWFEVLVGQAISSMKTSQKLITKTEEFEVENSKFTLPVDYAKFVSLRDCGQGVPLRRAAYCLDVDFQIQGSTLIFMNPVSDGTKVVLEYRGLHTDKDGNFVIPAEWERMLVAYIGWKYCRRYFNAQGPAKMQNYQREYQTQKVSNI